MRIEDVESMLELGMRDKLISEFQYFDDIFNFDAIDTAEKITGQKVTSDPNTNVAKVGLGLFLQSNRQKEQTAKTMNDTFMNISVGEYLMRVREIGFVLIYKETFLSYSTEKEETQYIFWHPRFSILLCFDTYSGMVNGGHFWYNYYYDWRQARKAKVDVTSSGQFVRDSFGKWIWVGDHDCRENLKFNILKMVVMGRFEPFWVEKPFLWLLHHNDKDEMRKAEEQEKTLEHRLQFYEKVNQRKISKFPLWVQICIHGGNYIATPVLGI